MVCIKALRPVALNLPDDHSKVLRISTCRLGVVPQAIRDAYLLPAAPSYLVPGLRSKSNGYLNRWYHNPNEADLEAGWR
jgi:hypothetical protein